MSGEPPETAGESPSSAETRKHRTYKRKQSSSATWTKPVVLNSGEQNSGEQPQFRAAPLDAPKGLQWKTPTRGWYPGSQAAGGTAKAPKGSQPKAPKQPQVRNCIGGESPL